MAAPEVAPGEAAAGAAAAARGGGLVVDRDGAQCGDGVGVLTGALEVGELQAGRAGIGVSHLGFGWCRLVAGS